ncbi:MAG: sigma-54 interaction domain-containing protein, partial [Solirubrobacteraceae bacterium]
EKRALVEDNLALRDQLAGRARLAQLLGKSRAMQKVFEMITKIHSVKTSVLITGESGTGKELVARALHSEGVRAKAPFVAVNCGAIPEELMESELFGHKRGSFTGAVADTLGMFQEANGGTLFLDEIGELSLALQVKLLRALQERKVKQVGSTDEFEVDVRVIAATNRDLEAEVARGAFRPDLYYRLNVIALYLPPLRQRRDDIPLLADHFLQRIAGLRSEAPKRLADPVLEAFQEYAWPGNVRELENAIERSIILTPGEEITIDSLPDRITERRVEPLVSTRTPPNPTLEAVERAYIMWVLQSENGNKSRAAEVLGIDPSTLYRKLSRYGVEA